MHAKGTKHARESAAVSDCTKILCVGLRKVEEPRIRKLGAYEIFWIYSSCRLLEYKQTFFGVVVLVFVRLFQPVCATLALFRFVSASFTLTTMAVGNTSEGFASFLSPWSI